MPVVVTVAREEARMLPPLWVKAGFWEDEVAWADSMTDRISLRAPRGRSMELLVLDDRGRMR